MRNGLWAWLAAAMVLAAIPAEGANANSGRTLYQTFCVFCHGTPPRGGADLAADDPARIRDAINGKVPAMASFRAVGFSDAQLADIAAYIKSLGLAPPGPAVPLFDYSDLWWNASESGWGLNLIQHAGTHNIFGVIYTYDAPNRPSWFVMAGGTWTSSTTFTGHLYRVSGPPGNGPFKPAHVTQVGEVVLLFFDRDSASVDYSVDGGHVTKQITRQPF